MRVKCSKCGGKAAITSRKEITSQVTELYCMCRNPACCHSFVATLNFSRTLGPSALDAAVGGHRGQAGPQV